MVQFFFFFLTKSTTQSSEMSNLVLTKLNLPPISCLQLKKERLRSIDDITTAVVVQFK
jgi:hypothetical protein